MTTIKRRRSETLRVALAGAGMISQHHLIAWSRLGNRAKVVAVADPDRGKAERLEITVGGTRFEHGDRLEAGRLPLHCIEDRPVVGGIAARLHQQGVEYAMGVEHRRECLARPRLVWPRPIASTIGKREAHGVDDVVVAVDAGSAIRFGAHRDLGIALVVTGSKRWSAPVSRATVDFAPGLRLVLRPTRAVSS